MLLEGLKVGTTGEVIPLRVNANGELVIAGVTLQAGTVTVSNEVEIKNGEGNAIPVSGPLTDVQLRAAALPVSGPLTDAQLRAAALPVAAATRSCVGWQTIVGLSTSAPQTLTVPGGAVAAMIQADGGSLRITQEGTAPTATVGSRVDDGVFYYVDTALASVKLLAMTSGVNVQVAFFDKA